MSSNINRVVMAVNNPATNDYRVVKSAEMVAKAGFDCHVVGVLKPGFKALEKINGVTYHRVKINIGLQSILAGYFPHFFIRIKNYFSLGHASTSEQQPSSTSLSTPILPMPARVLKRTAATLSAIKDSCIHQFKKLTRGKPYTKNAKYFVVHFLLNFIKPAASPIGVHYLQGRYLSSFYSRLMALQGDVYHAHELWMLESCALVAKKVDGALIYDSHELELHRNNNWSEKSNRARCHYEEQYIHAADEVLAVSEGCSKEIARAYGLNNISLLRNTPLASALTDVGEDLRENLGLAADTRLLIYTGSITINRGLEVVLSALKQLSGYQLVTVGPWNCLLYTSPSPRDS